MFHMRVPERYPWKIFREFCRNVTYCDSLWPDHPNVRLGSCRVSSFTKQMTSKEIINTSICFPYDYLSLISFFVCTSGSFYHIIWCRSVLCVVITTENFDFRVLTYYLPFLLSNFCDQVCLHVSSSNYLHTSTFVLSLFVC